MNQNYITLYPSNWLYNAGVLGLLRVLEKAGEDVNSWIQDDGSIKGDISNVLKDHVIEDTEFKIPKLGWAWLMVNWLDITDMESTNEKDKIKEVWGKLFYLYYRGFFNPNTKLLFNSSKTSEPQIIHFKNFMEKLLIGSDSADKCSFCNRRNNFLYKNYFSMEHSILLGGSASSSGVPNSFWNLNAKHSVKICDFCSFIILSHHLSLFKLSDKSEIFINAPSFKLMYYLNKFVQHTFSGKDKNTFLQKREILAMSIIDFSIKLKATLGTWAAMNIEIVTKNRNKIEFFSLPYQTIQLLLDRTVAAALSDIGEFGILNLVLNQEYSKILEFGYLLLKIALKKDRNKSDNEPINDHLFSLNNKEKNLLNTANKILKLYAIIEQKTKRSSKYGRTTEIAICN